MESWEFAQRQSLPYEAKKIHAAKVAYEFRDWAIEHGKNLCASIGGLDSLVLYKFLLSLGIEATPVSVSVLEDISIQKIHKQIPGMVFLKPLKSKVKIIREFGFPVISKEKAGKISMLQNPSPKNATVRHAIMTGDTGKQGGYRKGTRMKLPQKWLELFAGPENEKYGTNYKTAPFKVSNKCCYYLKEKACNDWQKKNNMIPYLGLMASEGGQREKALFKNGCNYFGKTVIRSAPFAIFSRQDLLQLALELDVPVPEIYGEIVKDADGTLRTTKAQRTGCSMCGFGIHLEKRPHRFDRLRESNYQEWKFWMYEVGWGEVLDYIGVGWEDEVK
ncbi:hypothetical protein [Geosporobacter ferrireducens]|uniref:hypothetical protein n=1 Tax=Geosporobacter ferrireducens TaxID=1424294 RepID=UPI00139B199B|nr:hypothetical protein [Geosporobacter ferrireducens]MTI56125.1 hypothetical protein [Geosporobacter ferrireducens]